jgi:hypothetical protein
LGKWLHFSPADRERAYRYILSEEWNCEDGTVTLPAGRLATTRKFLSYLKILYLDGATVNKSSPVDPVAVDRDRDDVKWDRSIMGPHNKKIAVLESYNRVVGLAEPSGAFSNNVQHGLNFCGRSSDGTQNRASCCLLIQQLLHGGHDLRIAAGCRHVAVSPGPAGRHRTLFR